MSAMAGERGVALPFPDGHYYRIDPQFYAWQVEQYEPALVPALIASLSGSAVFFDVGAHVGIIAMMAARRIAQTGGRVYAFEPAPPNFALLEQHLRANDLRGPVETARVLVGDRVADGVPFVHRREPFTANSLAYAIEDGVTTLTELITLDGFVAGGALPPTHLKIDVEGFEGAVLRGATDTLRRFRPLVMCAIHPEPLARLGETPRDIVRYMAAHDYGAFTLAGDPIDEPGFEDVLFRPVTSQR